MIDNSFFCIGVPSNDIDKQYDFSYDWLHLLESYKKVVNKNMLVLDIGSSSHIKAKGFASSCRKLVGLELFQERILNNFGNVEFINGDWQHLSDYFPEGHFDIIASSHVLEHVKDDLKALNEAYQVLKKGGHIIISTPNRKRLARAIIEFFKGERKFPYWEHIKEYVKQDLLNLIERSKFANCEYSVKGITLGLHGGAFWFYLKKFPSFLEKFAGFWEVVIKK